MTDQDQVATNARWPCCEHCSGPGHSKGHATSCQQCERPDLCWSRHLDNIGKPRPSVEWRLTYECTNGHAVTTDLCDRCASSLVDGRQRCRQCLMPMVVSRLETVDNNEAQHA